MNTRILAIYLPTPPPADSLPELATFLLKLSPRVGIRPPDTLYVDIGLTSHLFGGEARTIKQLRRLLEEKQIEA